MSAKKMMLLGVSVVVAGFILNGCKTFAKDEKTKSLIEYSGIAVLLGGVVIELIAIKKLG